MSLLNKKKIAHMVFSFVLALTLATFLSLSVTTTLSLTQNLPLILGTGAFMCLFVTLCTAFTKKSHFIFLFLFLTSILLAFLKVSPFYTFTQGVKALVLSQMGESISVLPYQEILVLFLSLLIAFFSALFCNQEDFLSALIFSLLLFVPCYVFALQPLPLLFALPIAFVLLLLVIKVHAGYSFPAFILVALLLLGIFFVTPNHITPNPFLKEQADKIRNFITDHLFFSAERDAFSLHSEGYLPLKERLGGAVTQNETPVMHVETEQDIYLKGVSYDQYNGFMWQDTLSKRRYLYASATQKEVKQSVFPHTLSLNTDEHTARITLLKDFTSTLFAPQRLLDILPQSERIVPYFNTASELFITRDLKAYDTYDVAYKNPYDLGSQLEQTIQSAQNNQDIHFETVRQNYLSLPTHFQKEIYDIANKATQNASTPYQKALQIQDYLRQNYTYTLDVSTPPDNIDFVAYFLLGEKEGYCTYFASALTVLCRMADIPARYVTGYLVEKGNANSATVTSQNAHAWTEIYLKGFGWLTLDATPYGSTLSSSNDQSAPPSSSPSPSPSPDTLANSTPSPSPSPSTSPTVSPSVAPSLSPSAPPSDIPDPASQTQNDKPFPFLLLLFALLLLALLLFFIYKREPVRYALSKGQNAPLYLMNALLVALSLLGFEKQVHESITDFFVRLSPHFENMSDSVATQYEAYLYGKKALSPSPFITLYRNTKNALPFYKKAWLRVRLLFVRK